MKRREYDEDEDNSMIKNYFQNKTYQQPPSPYGQHGYDSTYSQSYKYDDSFDSDQVQIKNKGNINMRVVSLHDDRVGIN